MMNPRSFQLALRETIFQYFPLGVGQGLTGRK